MLNNLFKL